MQSFVSGFFYFTECFELHPCCNRYQYFSPFFRLNTIPLYGDTKVCWLSYSLRGIQVVSYLGPLWIVLRTFTFMCQSHKYTPRHGIAVSSCKCMCHFLINCQTALYTHQPHRCSFFSTSSTNLLVSAYWMLAILVDAQSIRISIWLYLIQRIIKVKGSEILTYLVE